MRVYLFSGAPDARELALADIAVNTTTHETFKVRRPIEGVFYGVNADCKLPSPKGGR